MAAAQLEDVTNDTLFHEVLRRMKCAPESEKCLIFWQPWRKPMSCFCERRLSVLLAIWKTEAIGGVDRGSGWIDRDIQRRGSSNRFSCKSRMLSKFNSASLDSFTEGALFTESHLEISVICSYWSQIFVVFVAKGSGIFRPNCDRVSYYLWLLLTLSSHLHQYIWQCRGVYTRCRRIGGSYSR